MAKTVKQLKAEKKVLVSAMKFQDKFIGNKDPDPSKRKRMREAGIAATKAEARELKMIDKEIKELEKKESSKQKDMAVRKANASSKRKANPRNPSKPIKRKKK